jgi:hypothetical protein
MSFEVNTYSPSQVVLAFGGYPLTGWNTITIRKNQPFYTPVRGIRGKNTRYRNKDTSAVISFSCLQTGEANDIMSEIHRKDFTFGNARISLTLKDNSGNSLFHSSEAFIVDFPETTFSAQFEYRVWSIHCLSVDEWYTGGNLIAPNSLYSRVTNFVGDTISNIF